MSVLDPKANEVVTLSPSSSREKFVPLTRAGGFVLINCSFVTRTRKQQKIYCAPWLLDVGQLKLTCIFIIIITRNGQDIQVFNYCYKQEIETKTFLNFITFVYISCALVKSSVG